jgi:pimeloyl-ACP methyl ester carboxylesterase
MNNDTATLNVLKTINFSENYGYKNGLNDLMKFWMAGNRYVGNKAVASLPDETQLYADYSKLDWMTPVMRTGKTLFNYMNAMKMDLSRFKEFRVPIYFFVGRYDYTTSAVLAEQYFKSISAPKKELFWFEHSGHSPNWEEPELFYQRVLKIAGNNYAN